MESSTLERKGERKQEAELNDFTKNDWGNLSKNILAIKMDLSEIVVIVENLQKM